MTSCQQDASRADVVIRATERQGVWGCQQVLECVDCGRRWSQ